MAVFKNFSPYNKAYMDEYVEEGKALPFSRATNLFRTTVDDVIVPYQTVVCRYYDSLKKYIVEKTLTDEEYDLFKFNPRFLSKQLYGTPELWADLLYINNMVSVSEFKKRTVKVFTTNIIDAIIEIKLIIENDLIDNKNEIEQE